ncbi:toll/interleukin-1 receptor domain-containing protein [Caulobacter soli]|uniref:toll/interleukin-1 receptor domain-containing protein n=1 Tax=Caulobacter soli TaxID=2708539 RepID=UPI0013EE12B7|nr:toll/interleukin-1 receptor domain-containing protein [Caulobacter soli]
MSRIWLTYAWKDNENNDVDYIIQSMEKSGLEVEFDRKKLISGQRIWPALDAAIKNTNNIDGWAIYLTENSLRSEPCQEELAYALDRALRNRGSKFPLIGIFPSPIDHDLIPSAIATRLYVNLSDPDWVKKVQSGVSGRSFYKPSDIPPYVVRFYRHKNGPILEIRPRAGRWRNALAMVSLDQKDLLRFALVGPAGALPGSGIVHTSASGIDNLWVGERVNSPVDSLNSLFVFFTDLPNKLLTGSEDERLLLQIEGQNLNWVN